MERNSIWAAGRVLAAAMISLIVTVTLTSGAAGSTYKILYTFTGGADGCAAAFGLIRDAAGNLYGTRTQCGVYDWGTVFKLAPSTDGSWSFNVIYNFSGGDDGGFPGWGRLAPDAAGNLYGITTAGGAKNAGVIYEITQ